jgi:chloramphenicol O-acetyltransferase
LVTTPQNGHLTSCDFIKIGHTGKNRCGKKENAFKKQQYHLICLPNIRFKVFTMVGTNRISEVAHTVVRLT